MNSVHFSSKTCEWSTPQALFDVLDREFSFALDVCATNDNAKCELFFSPKTDGLAQSWASRVLKGAAWMNPPYGREIGKWVAKAAYEAALGLDVVALLPARTDTKWWHDHIWDVAMHAPRDGVEVRLLRGRLKFGGAKNAAPFPSAVVVFRRFGWGR